MPVARLKGEVIRPSIKGAAAALLLALTLSPISGWSQTNTVTVTAITDATCVGERAGGTRSCTSQDFAAIVSVEQESATALTRCLYGESLNLNIVATVAGANPDRYDVAVFFGQTGNVPRILDTTQKCSIGIVSPTTIVAPQTFPPPSTPTIFPFFDGDTDVCGDFRGKSFGPSNGFDSGVANLRVRGVKAACLPQPGSNAVGLPYTVVFDNVANSSCTTSNVTAGTNAKCSTGTPEVGARVSGLSVDGYVRITKQTVPGTSTQSFAFTATASSQPVVSGDTPSTTSFSLSQGNSQTVTVPLHPSGGTRTLVIQEALTSGWGPGASITCLKPDGSAATFVTVDNVNRRITANLTDTNGAANCTMTNTKQTRVRTDKTLVPSANTGRFNLTAAGVTVTNQGNGGTTDWQTVTAGTPQTFSETGFGGTVVSSYVNTYQCTDAITGAVLTSGTGTSVTLSPSAYSDSRCVFTNRAETNLSITKTNATTSLIAGSTTQYVITLNNTGPSDASGAVVSDPVAPGLNCYLASCEAVVGPPTATCPAALSVSALQAGVAIPSWPANSSIVFRLSCNVTATGVP